MSSGCCMRCRGAGCCGGTRERGPHLAVGRDASTPVTVRMLKVLSLSFKPPVALLASDISLTDLLRQPLPALGSLSCGVGQGGARLLRVLRVQLLPLRPLSTTQGPPVRAGCPSAQPDDRTLPVPDNAPAPTGGHHPRWRAAWTGFVGAHLGCLLCQLLCLLFRLELRLALPLHEDRDFLLLDGHGCWSSGGGGACRGRRGGQGEWSGGVLRGRCMERHPRPARPTSMASPTALQPGGGGNAINHPAASRRCTERQQRDAYVQRAGAAGRRACTAAASILAHTASISGAPIRLPPAKRRRKAPWRADAVDDRPEALGRFPSS